MRSKLLAALLCFIDVAAADAGQLSVRDVPTHLIVHFAGGCQHWKQPTIVADSDGGNQELYLAWCHYRLELGSRDAW